MSTKKEILAYLRTKKDEFKEQFGLSKLGLTGAHAIGNRLSNGGIEIFVEFVPQADNLRSKTTKLRHHLEDHFGTKIEIWREKYMKDYYKKGIFREAILV